MFEEYRRVSICRAISVCFMLLGVILINIVKAHTPPYYAAYVVMVPASLTLCVTDESKGWSIFWLVISIVTLAAALIELFH